jgi:hypothetical protein
LINKRLERSYTLGLCLILQCYRDVEGGMECGIWNKNNVETRKKNIFLAFADILRKDDFINIAILQSKWWRDFHHFNGKESTINRALGGSTYPSSKLVRYSLCKKILVVMKHSNLYLGLVLPSGGWQSFISSL